MVKFTLADMRKMSNRKAEIMREERIRLGNNTNAEQKLKNYEIEAERRAVKNIENLKMAGLLTPTPSPKKAAGRARATKVAAAPTGNVPNVSQSPGGRYRIGKKLCTSFKKDELVAILKRLGHRVDSKMTIKELCGSLRPKKAVSPPKRSPPKKAAAVSPPPVKQNAGTCMALSRGEAVAMAKAHGIRGYSKMTIKQICCALKGEASTPPREVALIAPVNANFGEPLLNVRKSTYNSHLKPALTKLAKEIGIRGYSKNRKNALVNRIRSKLETNLKAYFARANRSTVTAKNVSRALAKGNWKHPHHVERDTILKVFHQ